MNGLKELNKIFDNRIEAWSLCIILTKMLSGRVPFTDLDEVRLVIRIVNEQIDFFDDVWA